MTPREAYLYAKKHGSSEETRKIACREALIAFLYAYHVDKCPRDDTRKAICSHPNLKWSAEYAFYYARDIDKGSKENTRKVACKDLKWAYCYVLEVDKGFHEDTWAAVQNTEYEEEYNEFINARMKEEII